MAKGRHAKDKLYLTPNERKETGQGFQGKKEYGRMHFLTFDSCSLGMQPAQQPVISNDGYLFDFKNIQEFAKKYGKNPITGNSLKLNELRPVRFTRNKDNNIICPVTERVFTPHSHIVINLKSGYVFSNEAIDEVCRSLNLWEDPVTTEPFSRLTDLIDLQNPNEPPRQIDSNIFFENRELLKRAYDNQKEDVDCAKAIENNNGKEAHSDKDSPVVLPTTDISTPEEAAAPKPSTKDAPSVNLDAQGLRVKEMIDNLKADGLVASHKKLNLSRRVIKPPEDPGKSVKSAYHSTGALAQSLTSTAADFTANNEMRTLTDIEVRTRIYLEVRKSKKKGYVRIVTSHGNLSLLLHCDLAPLACHSFLLHAESGYYNDLDIFRIIPRFIFQTGDPKNTGMGGKSAFIGGEPFKDEFDVTLNHIGPGVVGMANNGPGTNGSQFYITLASAPHLDKAHTVFGKVVGGKHILTRIENVKQTGGVPSEPPKIVEIEVFQNPFKDTEFYKHFDDGTTNPQDESEAYKPVPETPESRAAKLNRDLEEANGFVFGSNLKRNMGSLGKKENKVPKR